MALSFLLGMFSLSSTFVRLSPMQLVPIRTKEDQVRGSPFEANLDRIRSYNILPLQDLDYSTLMRVSLSKGQTIYHNMRIPFRLLECQCHASISSLGTYYHSTLPNKLFGMPISLQFEVWEGNKKPEIKALHVYRDNSCKYAAIAMPLIYEF